ncbi:unnamed protein product [Thlaspi arvense]|uniref:LisH domain-containing protein n=1 Tax=Thlaspi arvense TaxID=13288 RepID=A0AAU9SDI3_THLAR|nr:unnamed protein product [Thlaspi arvense]
MDDYTREMMDLKTLVTRTLEKKGVLAKIRAELRRLLSALICEYLDWAQLNHTLKVYQPECNLPKDSWKSELRDFSSNNGYELNRNGGSGPLLLDVLEGFLNFEKTQAVGGGSSRRESETESSSNSLPTQRRSISASQASERRGDNWRYDSEDGTEEVMRASAALENLQLDRKTRNLTSSWRDGTSEEEEEGKD